MSEHHRFTSHGGGRHHTAVIGHPPESREWKPGDPTYAPCVEPTARIEAFVTVDAGLGRATYIGERAWLMKHVHVGHDAIVHDDCELAPGTVIGGHAFVGRGVRCGIGSLVLPFVRIGSGARIGAGAVVTQDVPPGQVWAGNPARNLHPERTRMATYDGTLEPKRTSLTLNEARAQIGLPAVVR